MTAGAWHDGGMTTCGRWATISVTAILALAGACDPVEDDAGTGAGTGDASADGGGDGADGVSADDGGDGVDESGGGNGADDPLGAVGPHNAVRAAAQPMPQPALPDLVWDAELAAVAQAWAEGCNFEHSTGPFGENLYAATGMPSAADAVDAWASEIEFYDYESNGCSGVCGHYTQIVWRDTARVGCGFADCPSIAGAGFGGRMWVCNYDPPGNFVGQRPY